MYLTKAVITMNLAYWLYMNEAGGYDDMVSTRRAKLNAIGRELWGRGYAGQVVPAEVFSFLLSKHNLSSITEDEITYIEENWL